MFIFIKWTSDLAQIDHVFLSQIWLALDHFYYYRWTRARTNRYYLSWTELCAKSILISRKSSPLEKDWFTLQRTILQFKLETFKKQSRFSRQPPQTKQSNMWSFKESCTVDLTPHCCACGLREEWNKQEIDEVDEGQGIVPEQASCRGKKDKCRLNSKSTFWSLQTTKLLLNAANSRASLLLCVHYITFNRK